MGVKISCQLRAMRAIIWALAALAVARRQADPGSSEEMKMVYAITRDGTRLLSFGSVEARRAALARFNDLGPGSLAALSKIAANSVCAQGGYATHPAVTDSVEVVPGNPKAVFAYFIR